MVQRRRYARLLRALATGRLTNDEYEAAVDDAIDLKIDKAITKIHHMAWLLYNDTFEHRLRGPWALDRKTRRIVAAWLLFLYSDLEFGKDTGQELGIWPFPDRGELEETASRRPRFYCGQESLPSGVAPFRTGRLRDDEVMESFRHRLAPSAIAALTVCFFIWRENKYAPDCILPLIAFALAITVLSSASFLYKPLDSIKITIWQFVIGLGLIVSAAVYLALYVF